MLPENTNMYMAIAQVTAVEAVAIVRVVQGVFGVAQDVVLEEEAEEVESNKFYDEPAGQFFSKASL